MPCARLCVSWCMGRAQEKATYTMIVILRPGAELPHFKKLISTMSTLLYEKNFFLKLTPI